MHTSTILLRAAKTILLLSICGMILLPNPSNAQTYIGFVNPSFELPGVAKIKGWDGACSDATWTGSTEDIPGWYSAKTAFDSGVESTGIATDGVWTAFLMGSDTSVYQVTEHLIVDGDDITLFVDAKNTWQATTLKIEIFSQDTLAVNTTLESVSVTVTNDMTKFSLPFKVANHMDVIGQKLGVAFDNVTPVGQSWVGLDNVYAINLNPSIEVVNFSFELPGTAKVKGWDGACADPGWTGLLYDIPGWQSDSTAWDSGVETGYTPTKGLWTAFMMGQDTSVYQITNHVIEEGDEIDMLVDARITWAATNFEMAFFYEDNGSKILLNKEEWDLTDTMTEYYVNFSAANHPESIGHKLGISFDNISTAQSWIGLDNVRLINYKGSAVSSPRLAGPSDFALEQNYPNPFNPSTTIYYTLQKSEKVQLSVYDVRGREVAVLVNGVQSAGKHQTNFTGLGLTSGIYFYRLQTTDQLITKKMTLLK